MQAPGKQLLAEVDWFASVICCYVCLLSTGSVLLKSISPAFAEPGNLVKSEVKPGPAQMPDLSAATITAPIY